MMNIKEILRQLKVAYPEATRIVQNEYGLWDVEIEDEFETVIMTYKVEGTRLRFIGEMTVEQ